MSSYRNYYDSTFGRRADSAGKSEARSQPSRIATKYGGSYSSNITGPAPRIKTFLDKETHPPVSYKSPLSRSSARSRDPSPSLDKSEKSATSSSSSYLSPNRLYPRALASKSRESTLSPTSSSTNLPRLTTKKESGVASKYKTSREDLCGTGPKYLSSRFLPKNSVERSFTAYTRPSTIRTHEASRKNKELLSVLHAQQEQEKLSSSRSTSRCSSLAPEEAPKKPNKQKSPEVELETIKVCTRGTSPTLGSSTQPSFLRSRRMELAKTIEKTITRPKTKRENMVDKEIQSDRLDDSTKSSRFAGASRISATPWTNFLDMKFNSPNNKKLKQDNDSPKSLSRTSSTKSVASIKSDKDTKKPLKSKLTPPKQLTDKKQLPPPIPKSESSSKSFHSLNTPNKDFRKSVLNMNPDGTKKKLGRRSNSASSADSDNADPDATDASENLNSYVAPRRSPSSDISTPGQSSSEDEKTKKIISAKNEAEAKNFLMRALAPVTNLFKGNNRQSVLDNNSDTISNETGDINKVVWVLDPSSENQSSPEPKSAKIVLHRLEADQKNWWDESSEISSELQQSSEPANTKYEDLQVYSGYNAENNMTAPLSSKLSRIRPADCGEKAWWLDENALAPDGVQTWKPPDSLEKPNKIQHVRSGEKPWWIEENPKEIPDNVKVWNPDTQSYLDPAGDNAWWSKEEPEKPKIRPIESGEAPWWIKKDSTPPEGVQTWVPAEQTEFVETHKLRHIDSGERAWWLNDDEAPVKDNSEPKFTITHQNSGEKAWWLDQNQEEFDIQQEPLGDRASPEGLEMPKDTEASGRLSPYDNVPMGKKRAQKLFISKHKNIDDLLGGTGLLWSPLMNKIFGYDKEECREVDAKEVIIHEGTGAGVRSDPVTSYRKVSLDFSPFAFLPRKRTIIIIMSDS